MLIMKKVDFLLTVIVCLHKIWLIYVKLTLADYTVPCEGIKLNVCVSIGNVKR